jgi:hypothetical protein
VLGDGDKEIEIVHSEKNILKWAAGAAKAEQKYIVPARKAQRTTKELPLSFVFFESPFT